MKKEIGLTASPQENHSLPPNQDWESLFDELCKTHRLKWRQKWLLKNISQSLNVEPAVRLFIEPDWFVAATKIQGLQHRKKQIADLCKILFKRENGLTEENGKRSQKDVQNEPLVNV